MFNKKLFFNENRYNVKSIYVKILGIFMLIFSAAILIVGIFSYYSSSQIIQKKVDEANAQVILQVQEKIEGMMEKVDTFAFNLTMYHLLQTEYEDLTMQEKLLIKGGFFFPLKNEDYIDTVYIYYFKTQKVIKILSSDSGVVDVNSMVDKDWLGSLDNMELSGDASYYINERKMLKNDGQIHVLSMIKGFPLMAQDKNGVVIINIDKNKVFGKVEKSLPVGQEILVLDSNDNVIFGSDKYFNDIKTNNLSESPEDKAHFGINTKKYMISQIVSQRNGWKYLKIQDKSLLTSDTRGVRNFIGSILIICFIIGFIISNKIAIGIHKPLVKLIEKILPFEKIMNNGKSSKNEMDVLGEVIDNVIYEKNSIETLYINSRDEIVKGLLLRLCSNEEIDSKYLNDQMKRLNFPTTGYNHVVAVLKIDDYQAINSEHPDEMAMFKSVLADIIDNNIGNIVPQLNTFVQVDKIVILIAYNESIDEFIKACFKMQEMIIDSYSISITIGIGEQFKNVDYTFQSFNDAMEALNYAVFSGKGSVNYIKNYTMDNEFPKYYYPIAKESELMDAIKLGNTTDALKIVDLICEGIPKSSYMVGYVSDLLWQIVNRIFISANSLGIKYEDMLGVDLFTNYKEFKSMNDINEMLNYIKDKVELCALYVQKKRNNKSEELIDAIKTFITKNYYKNISLNDVSSIVFMSPSYVSNLFKDSTGESVPEFIKRIRMEKAKELLSTTNKNVEKISAEVGYENARSFIRAFKAYTGHTPGECRKDHIVDNLEQKS